jgi:hypothetical protein
MSPIADPTRPPKTRAAAPTRVRPGKDGVEIKLMAAQVDKVVRAASGNGTVSSLLTGLGHVRKTLENDPGQLKDKRLSRALLLGLLMLACYPADGSYMRNIDLAAILDLDTATTHRYVSTLVTAGLLVRDHATRQCRLAL